MEKSTAPLHQLEFSHLLSRIVAVPVLLSVVIIAFFLWELESLRTASVAESNADRIITQAHHVVKLMVDAETGVRGYVIFGKNNFLEPYDYSISNFEKEAQALRAMVVENPTQTEALNSILQMIDEWFSLARQSIAKRNIGKGIQDAALNEEGKRMMDDIRTQFERFISVEVKLRDERAKQAQDIARLVVVSGVVFSILVGIFLFSFIRKTVLKLSLSYAETVNYLQRQSRELLESREWFSTTLNSIGDAVVVVDVQSRVQFLNPLAEDLTGWKLSEAKNRPMSEVFHIINEKTRQTLNNPVEKVLADGKIIGLANHTVLISKNKAEYPIEDSAAPIRDGHGQTLGVVLIFRDVSEKQKIQRALKESEQRFQVLANAAPVLIWSSGTNKLCDWFNQGWLDFTGRSMEQEQGNGWTSGLHPDDLKQCLKTYTTAFDKREPFETEYRLRRHDGEYRWILDKGVPRFNLENEFEGYIGSCSDITEMRANRERMALMASNLRMAVQSRDDFLSVASHELKTPLTSLKLQLELAQKGLASDTTANSLQKRLNICLEQIQRLVKLVEDLLDVSKIQSGKLTYHFQDTNLSDLVRDVIQRLQDHIPDTKIILDANQAVLARVDRFRVDQILVNLLTNAVKYGEGKPIFVQVVSDLEMAKIIVKDEGTGIPKDKHMWIFERFGRAVGAENISGMGLGLFIAKQIALAHGGRIEVESEVGKGSVFQLYLPLHQNVQSWALDNQSDTNLIGVRENE